MADVYRILDKISEKQYTCDTPDGRGKSKKYCYARLARIICGDSDMVSKEELNKIALYVYDAQKEIIKEKIRSAIDQFIRRFVTPISKIKFNITGLGADILLKPALLELEIPEKQISYRALTDTEHVVSTAFCLGILYLKTLIENQINNPNDNESIDV